MRIWLIKAGEPLPIDGKDIRLFRMGILATMLAQRNHEVTWWTSTVDHVRKKHRFSDNTRLKISGNFEIRLMKSILYKKNVGIARIVNHHREAHIFSVWATQMVPPDVIVCSMPTIEFSLAAVRYGRKHQVPVILDIRDLWPDIFLELGPRWAEPVLGLFLKYWWKGLNEACSGATAIAGITEEFVEWGLQHAGRARSQLDQCFPHGYSEEKVSTEAIAEAIRKWGRFGIPRKLGGFIVCFFGNFGRQFELETVIEAAQKLKKGNQGIQFVLCGNGDRYSYYRNLAKDCDNIIFPGRVNAVEIYALMKLSSVGLAPYLSNPGFVTNLPNKPIEYMSMGLPIVSSLKGVLQDLLKEHRCGLTYKNYDAEGLVRILCDLYDHPQHLAELSENSYNLFIQKYTSSKVYGNMCTYLEGITSQKLPL